VASKLLAIAAVCLVLAACSKCQTPPPPLDGSLPAAPVDAGVAKDSAEDALQVTPPAPRAATLALVALGRRRGARVVWLQAHGQRVWLSGAGFDAYADGDGLLVPGHDLLDGLPYQSSKHRIIVAGHYPKLVALRALKEDSPTGAEVAAFVYQPPLWTRAGALRSSEELPAAFVPWGEGALLVESRLTPDRRVNQINPSLPAAWLEYIDRDGKVSDPKLPVPRALLPWAAASDGSTLSLIGYTESAWKGVELVRGDAKGFVSAVVSTRNAPEMRDLQVTENGQAALVFQSALSARGASKEVVVVRDGAAAPRGAGSGDAVECPFVDGVMIDGDAFLIRRCVMTGGTLVRVPAVGPASEVELPRVDAAGGQALRCHPKKLVVRAPNDLWIQAACGVGDEGDLVDAVPAVFRRGFPQEPLILP